MNLGDLFSHLTAGGNTERMATGISPGETDVMSGLSDAKQTMNQALMELVDLQPGETFRGQVLDINSQGVTVQSGDASFQAKFLEPVELHIGDQLSFEVRENQDGLVTIAPIKDSVILGEEGLIYKALNKAGLAATDRNLDVAESLLKNGMAMDHDSITRIAGESLKFPDVPVSHLVLMEKYGLEIEQNNVRNFENYANWSSKTVEQLDIVKQQFPELLQQVVSEAGKQLQSGQGIPEKTELLKELLSTMIRELPEGETQREHPFVVLRNLLEQYEGAPKEQVGQVKNELLAYVRENGEILKNALGEQLSIRPEELGTQKLNHFYGKLDTLMGQLKELSLPETPGDSPSPVSEAAKQVQSELAFLGQMNQGNHGRQAAEKMMAMLPLKLKNQITQGNLYVYSKKHGGWDINAGVSLFLHLDMESLGPLDVMMEMKRKDVLMTFSTEDEDSARILREHLNQLTERLGTKGYHLSGNVRKKEEDRDFEKDFLRKGEETKNLLRYSFDMRV